MTTLTTHEFLFAHTHSHLSLHSPSSFPVDANTILPDLISQSAHRVVLLGEALSLPPPLLSNQAPPALSTRFCPSPLQPRAPSAHGTPDHRLKLSSIPAMTNVFYQNPPPFGWFPGPFDCSDGAFGSTFLQHPSPTPTVLWNPAVMSLRP